VHAVQVWVTGGRSILLGASIIIMIAVGDHRQTDRCQLIGGLLVTAGDDFTIQIVLLYQART